MKLFDHKNIQSAIVLVMLAYCNPGCSQTPENNKVEGYNLKKPVAYYTLPDTLKEISGLTDIDSAHIGCVQDERGIIFIYNLFEARIESRYTFHFDGDYEGITRFGNDMYVLRSDGYLFRMKNFMLNEHAEKDSMATGIPITNNEGLCLDEKNKKLLIAAKGRIKQSKDTRDLRFVYAFNLDSLKVEEEPVLILDINDVGSKMEELGMSVSKVTKKNGNVKFADLKFMPSSIAIHPITDRVYILSAVDHLLLVVNRKGDILNVVRLDETLYPKPEGITFLPNGDMLICNEGKTGSANLMRFILAQ